jgi:hypothetical protein
LPKTKKTDPLRVNPERKNVSSRTVSNRRMMIIPRAPLDTRCKKLEGFYPSSPYELQETELIGTEPVQDLVDLTIHTAYVKFERINSLMLVGEPETGKTEMLKKFRKNHGVHSRRRFTAYGIINDLIKGRIKPLFSSPLILGDIIVYDYANVFTYKPNTTDSTIEFLDAITEEGLAPESSYWITGDELKPFEGLRAGIIAGINTFGFFTSGRKVKANLYKGGWFSRNVVATFDISETLLTKIFDSVKRGDYRADRRFVDCIILQLPIKRIDVKIPEKYADKIGDLARELAEGYTKDLKPYKLKGLRLDKSLISLTKASALREHRSSVNEEDYERVKYLSQWMNLRMNTLKADDYPFPVKRNEG